MIRKVLTITIVAVTCNNGCSVISQRLPDLQLSNQNIDIQSTKTMLYDLIDPRRKQASQEESRIIGLATSAENTYFSASGHQCKIVTRHSRKSVCFIDGIWQEAAPIFDLRSL